MVIWLLFILAAFLLMVSFLKIVDKQYESDLQILGLDILTPSSIRFALSDDNSICLLCSFLFIYNDEPCYKAKALAKLMGATLEVKNNTLYWTINGCVRYTTSHGDHVVIKPSGHEIDYDKRSYYKVYPFDEPQNGILRDSSNGKYEFLKIDMIEVHKYNVIDTYKWNTK